jgi:hypothetical protein
LIAILLLQHLQSCVARRGRAQRVALTMRVLLVTTLTTTMLLLLLLLLLL